MELEVLKKASLNLESKDIQSKITNDTLYVLIGDTELELSEFEITYQANEYDENEDND